MLVCSGEMSPFPKEKDESLSVMKAAFATLLCWQVPLPFGYIPMFGTADWTRTSTLLMENQALNLAGLPFPHNGISWRKVKESNFRGISPASD